MLTSSQANFRTHLVYNIFVVMRPSFLTQNSSQRCREILCGKFWIGTTFRSMKLKYSKHCRGTRIIFSTKSILKFHRVSIRWAKREHYRDGYAEQDVFDLKSVLKNLKYCLRPTEILHADFVELVVPTQLFSAAERLQIYEFPYGR